MLDKLKQFIVERAKWKKAGSPYRTEEEIGHIFKICAGNQCGQYQPNVPTEGNCGLCGCRLTSSKQFWSKNSWATTNCPHDPPFWTANISADKIEISEEEIELEEVATEEKQEQPPEPPKRSGCGCGG